MTPSNGAPLAEIRDLSVRFVSRDVDPLVAGKRCGIEPRAIGEQRVATERSYRRFQVQAAGDGHGEHFVVVGLEQGAKLTDAFLVGAA